VNIGSAPLPPFFKRGPAPLALLSLYVAASVFLFVLDVRFDALLRVRQGIAFVVDPVQRLAQSPVRWGEAGLEYFRSLAELRAENDAIRRQALENAPRLLRLDALEAENARLSALLSLSRRLPVSAQAARIMAAERDPYVNRVFLDKGLQAGVQPGAPVIDESGLIGQVRRVLPFGAEASLITDRDQSVPVEILRTGQRSLVSGDGAGLLDLRYLPSNADVEVGDLLVTSGLDGVYPPGLPVARIERIERDSAEEFAEIEASPIGHVDSHRTVMVLAPMEKEMPDAAAASSPDNAATPPAPQETAPNAADNTNAKERR
jgi:rod shape-determining protein MreC